MTPLEFQALTGATPAQMADLESFIDRLAEANAVMNLVGPVTIPDVWNRHIWDSAQLLERAPDAGTWARAKGWTVWKALIVVAGLPGSNFRQKPLWARALAEVIRDPEG